MTPPQSAPRSPSKASKVGFIILKTLKIGRTDGQTDEGGVGLSIAFCVDWCWNYAEIWSGGRFMVVLGDRKHLLLITHVFERNYLISLR